MSEGNRNWKIGSQVVILTCKSAQTHPRPVYELRWRPVTQARIPEFLGPQQTLPSFKLLLLLDMVRWHRLAQKHKHFLWRCHPAQSGPGRVLSSTQRFLDLSITWSAFTTRFPSSRKCLETIPKYGCAILVATKLPPRHIIEPTPYVLYFPRHTWLAVISAGIRERSIVSLHALRFIGLAVVFRALNFCFRPNLEGDFFRNDVFVTGKSWKALPTWGHCKLNSQLKAFWVSW